MARIWLRYDFRSPEFGTRTNDLCKAALEQVAWADALGFECVQLSEHHGSPDGYNPSPLIIGAAMAARTSNIRIHPCAMLLPYHDPVRLAEDAIMLDNISNGRLDLTFGIGYVASEFEMFGIPRGTRTQLMESKLSALRRALTGETFDYEGRRIHVTPRPVQTPGPRLFVGGAVAASARRAARFGDGFAPTVYTAELTDEYRRACTELGKPSGPILNFTSPTIISVAEDPDLAWDRLGRYVLHDMNSYAKWATEGDSITPFAAAEDVAAVRASGYYRVVTPDECVAIANSQTRQGLTLAMHPLLGGMPPDLAWASLELFASKVLPRLDKTLPAGS